MGALADVQAAAGAGAPRARPACRSTTARSRRSATRCTAPSPTSTSTRCSTGSPPSTVTPDRSTSTPTTSPTATGRRCSAAGHDQPDGFPCDPGVVGRRARAVMDRLGIATSLLSVSSPGVHLGDAAVDLAREVNEAGRRAVVDHPGRFGLLASLPLPDVDAAIAEIAHCCDHLDVDGFVLLTNVGGTYLGDPSFEPVFRELDRRRARVLAAPDVAGVLGADVVRPAPTDARVPLRHHPHRRRPGAERHHRPPPRPRARSSRTPAPTLPLVADRVQRVLAPARRRSGRRRAPRPRPAPLRPRRPRRAPPARRAARR